MSSFLGAPLAIVLIIFGIIVLVAAAIIHWLLLILGVVLIAVGLYFGTDRGPRWFVMVSLIGRTSTHRTAHRTHGRSSTRNLLPIVSSGPDLHRAVRPDLRDQPPS